jgi:hypothetical protein
MNKICHRKIPALNLVQGWLGRVPVVACSLFLLCLVAGCSHHGQGLAFATPDAAVDSMVTALRSSNQPELFRILGPEADDVLSSGDPVDDARVKAEFLRRYDQNHGLVPDQNGRSMTLEVGDTHWPLPIPIVKASDGWRFDTAAGLDEILNRRIGRDELDTIETCRAANDAQADYFAANPRKSPVPEYARKFISSEGTRDGLYWPTGEGEPLSPLGALMAEAADEGYRITGKGNPYHGYFYRMLTAQGDFAPGGRMSYLTGDSLTKGFGVVAYPAQYGNSGIMTFIVNQQGIVYQRDLGADTANIAKAMTEFDPDPNWTVAK